MDNLKKALNLIFGQQLGKGITSNPALAGLDASMIDPNQNDMTGVLYPSLFSKAAVPSLIGGSLLQAFPGSIPKAIGGGLDALSLLSMLSQ